MALLGQRPGRANAGRALPAIAYDLLYSVVDDLRRPRAGWWAWLDLNQRPHPYQGCALTN